VFKAVSTWRICPELVSAPPPFVPRQARKGPQLLGKNSKPLHVSASRILIYGLSRSQTSASWTGFGSRWSFSLCRGLLASLEEGFSPRVSSHGWRKVVVARFTVVCCGYVEHQLAIADRPDRIASEWLHAIDGFPVHEHFALFDICRRKILRSCVLHRRWGMFNEKDAAFLVKLDHHPRDRNETSTGLLPVSSAILSMISCGKA